MIIRMQLAFIGSLFMLSADTAAHIFAVMFFGLSAMRLK